MQEDQKIRRIPQEISPQSLKPEQPLEKEARKEQEQPSGVSSKRVREEVVVPVQSSTAVLSRPIAAAQTKSQELLAIESILEEGLQETYWQLPPRIQMQLRKQGEKTAQKIERLLRAAHVNIVKILKLIRKWLACIPAVNDFFLEQEAKIKTDKIIALYRERKDIP